MHARIIVLALIPVAGFLANGLRRNRRSTEFGDTVNSRRGQSRFRRSPRRGGGNEPGRRRNDRCPFLSLGVKDLADSVVVEAEGLEAQVRQFLNNVQAAYFFSLAKPSMTRTGLQSPRQ